MSKIETFQDAFDFIVGKYEGSEKVRKPLKKYEDPLQISCNDTNHGFLININKDQGIEIVDNAGDDAPVKIEFASEKSFFDLLNGELPPVKGYSSGQIKVVEGEIKNLLKLRKLLF